MGTIGHFVGPYEIAEPTWAPEDGAWFLGRDAADAEALIRVAAPADRPALELQRNTLRRISDPRVPAVLAHDDLIGGLALSPAIGTPLIEAIEQRTEEGGDGVVLTPATLLDLLREVGRGLEAAHSVDVINGGLDPERVLLSREGRIWLFGFGSGQPPGTPWLPPELARGQAATTATDVWSLGAIGAGLVLGHPIWPWHDRRSVHTPGGGVIADGDCSTLVHSIHEQWPALGRAFGRALAAQPADRYPSIDAFLAELDELIQVAGGVSQRAELGALLWSRRGQHREAPAGGAPTAVPSGELAWADDLQLVPAAPPRPGRRR